MKHVMISGATGYIGISLIRELVKQYRVYALVRKESDLSELNTLIDKECIIQINDDNVYEIIRKARPEYYINLMGRFIAEHSANNLAELLESNFDIPVRLLDAVCQAGCKKIINTGTYWQNFNGESNNPVDLYGAVKNAFENIIKYYVEVMGCRNVTLQLFDTYGPKDRRKKLLTVLSEMKDGDSIDLSDCMQKVYYCHIKDVTSAYVAAMRLLDTAKDGYMEVFAVRDEKPVVLRDAVMELIKIANKDVTLNFGMRRNRNREIINPEGIGKTIPGWKCTVPLEQGLKEILE